MYTIDFDIVAIIVYVTLLCVHLALYDGRSRGGIHYRLFILCGLMETIFDILSALSIDRIIHVSDALAVWITVVFYMFMHFGSAVGCSMVATRMNHLTKTIKNFGIFLLCSGLVVMIANGFLGFGFYFDNGVYVSTPLSLIFTFMSIPYLIIIIYTMVKKGAEISFHDRIGPSCLVISVLITFTLQQVFPLILLSCLGKAVASIVYCTYYDTPEHIKFQNAVDELGTSQQLEYLALKDLKEANDRKNEFLIEMSHNFRTPVNAIMGFNQVVLREFRDDKVVSEAMKIGESGRRLIDLIMMTEDFAQLETGLVELRPFEYKVEDAFLMIQKRVNGYLPTDAKINSTFSDDMPKRLYGDIRKINQVLEVAVSFFASNESCGDINIDIKRGHMEGNRVYIDFVLTHENKNINVFSDDYAGDMEYQFLIKLIQAMNGDCVTTYDEYAGSVLNFGFYQEIVDMKPIGDIYSIVRNIDVAAVFLPEKKPFIMPKARVLAVDDMKINLLVLSGLFNQYKVNLTTAMSGKEALGLMRENEYDIVFMDILMPEMDGTEVLKHIREDQDILSKDIPIIALTANVFLGARNKYISDGFSEYISKPVSISALGSALDQFLPELKEEEWDEIDVSYESDESTEIASEDMTAEETPEIPENITLYDIPGIDVKKGIHQCCGTMELYEEVCKHFCTSGLDDKLKEYYDTKDWDNYRITIHALKSTSRTVGLEELGGRAADLESAVKNEDIAYIDKNHDKWLKDYRTIVDMMLRAL